MKRNLKFVAVVILCLAVIGVFGQTKPERAPITLSPEASRQWKELNLQIQNLQLRQQLIAAREKVPEDYLIAGFDQQTGQVVYVAPPLAPTPKPESAKKGNQ